MQKSAQEKDETRLVRVCRLLGMCDEFTRFAERQCGFVLARRLRRACQWSATAAPTSIPPWPRRKRAGSARCTNCGLKVLFNFYSTTCNLFGDLHGIVSKIECGRDANESETVGTVEKLVPEDKLKSKLKVSSKFQIQCQSIV